MDSIQLKSGRPGRAVYGHPWVFAGELKKQLPVRYNGKAVLCYDSRNHLLGSGIYNNKSKIIWRRFTTEKHEFDKSWIEPALKMAIDIRKEEPYRRLVWSESDFLPGLVVDQYNDILVVQALTKAVDLQLPVICKVLQKLLKPAEIVIRNDNAVRRHEGLELETRTFSGNPLGEKVFEIEGVRFLLDLEKGQKTGFYLDQRLEYAKLAAHASGKHVLDAFCNQGAFALHCAKAGATSVLGIDSSEAAISHAQKNAKENNLEIDFEEENVFDFFKENAQKKWDIIILDPPPFAKSKKHLQDAMRGYKEINLRAMKALNPGGILATYTCSYHVDHETFSTMLRNAATDASATMKIIGFSHQPPDHPILLHMPESEYLHGIILKKVL